MKRVENKIKKYINQKLEGMENYVEYKYDEYLSDSVKFENTAEIKLIDFEMKLLDYNHEEKLFDIRFNVRHKSINYTFETSNYYFFKGEFRWVEDIYENIGNLLSNFRFLLENYDYFIGKDDSSYEEDEFEGDTIDDIAYDMGFEIDDDGHWIEVDNFYFDEYDSFKDSLDYDDGKYIFNFSEDNGRFYWKD